MCVRAQGDANGKPYWSKVGHGSTQHIYWAPDDKRQWLLRSKFTPTMQICSAYYEGDTLRTGPSSWQWAQDSTWVSHPMSIVQPGADAVKDKDSPFHPMNIALAARRSRLSDLQCTTIPASGLAIFGSDLDSFRFGPPTVIQKPVKADHLTAHPPAEQPPQEGGCYHRYRDGVSSQLGPFLSDKASGMNVTPGDPLLRAPPLPFETFEGLSNAVMDIVELDDSPGALSSRRYTITLARTDHQGCADIATAHQIQRTWLQVHDLAEAMHTSGDLGAEDLKGLASSEVGDEMLRSNTAVRLLKLREVLKALLRKHPAAVELHAFLGWGPAGEAEKCTLSDLRQRRSNLIQTRAKAMRCKEAMEKRLVDAQAAAANAEGREQLQVLKMAELRKRAISAGINEDKLEDYYDLDQPKAAIVDAILKAWQDPQRILRLFSRDVSHPVALLVAGSGMAYVDGVYFQSGCNGTYPYYQNADRTSLCRTQDVKDSSNFSWKLQRTVGGDACSAYLHRYDAGTAPPIGEHPWWCCSRCTSTAFQGGKLWQVRPVTITALSDDAQVNSGAATLFPECFRVPDPVCMPEQDLPFQDLWTRSYKFLTPSLLHSQGSAHVSVQFPPPAEPPNCYAVPLVGRLVPPSMLCSENADEPGHLAPDCLEDGKWPKLTLDAACRLARNSFVQCQGLVSLTEALALLD